MSQKFQENLSKYLIVLKKDIKVLLLFIICEWRVTGVFVNFDKLEQHEL